MDRNQYVENVTLSIGIASAAAEVSLEALLQRADLALYAAKRAGRNRVSASDSTKLTP